MLKAVKWTATRILCSAAHQDVLKMPTDLTVAFTTLFSVILFCSFLSFYFLRLVELVSAAEVKEAAWER